MTVDGVRTVARQEFMQRIRKGRWRWLLAAWFVVLLVVTVLIRLALNDVGEEIVPYRGAVMYGGLMLLVLSLALLVVPALAAQSVNGDRERGVLATLQVTRLSALEIALGKFAAAWGTTLVFLALTAPLVLWCLGEGGVDGESVVVVTAVMAVLLGTVCAVALALSALLSRSTTSSVLSYLSVFALTLGTLIVFGLATAVTQEKVERSFDIGNGQRETYLESRARTDRVWWLLAPNPFVVLADSAPRLPRRSDPVTGQPVASPLDPLGDIGNAVREARRPPRDHVHAYDGLSTEPAPLPGPVWPYGLAFDVLLAAGAVVVTVRRLRTPARRLPRGVRIA